MIAIQNCIMMPKISRRHCRRRHRHRDHGVSTGYLPDTETNLDTIRYEAQQSRCEWALGRPIPLTIRRYAESTTE